MRAVPLTAILSLLALATSIVRALAQVQFAGDGGAITVRWVLLVETGNWISWTVWGAVLARAIRRIAARSPLDSRAIASLAGLAVAPIVAVPIIASPWFLLVSGSSGILDSAGHIAGHNLPTNLLLGILMLGVAHGFASLDRSRQLERTASDLRARLAESQLDTLRAQLDPHFLFNALNSVSVLARRGDVQQADLMITRLAGLLRHSLESSRAQLVPFRVELEALRHYTEIEQVRHGARLMVEWEVPEALRDISLPSFILQPLVENAIRHGFVDGARPLHLSISASAQADVLVIHVSDDGAGVNSTDSPSEGVGLGNTRARLAALYGEGGTLTLEPGDAGVGTRVTIRIPSARHA